MNLHIGVRAMSKSERPWFVTYTDEANGFSIDYPQGWGIEHPSRPPEVKVAIWKRESDGNPLGILVAKYKASGWSLLRFKSLKWLLLGRPKDYVPISTEKLNINGVPATKHAYTSTVISAVTHDCYIRIKVYLVKNKTGWILAFDCPQKSLDSYESIFGTAINSFRLFK